WSTMFARSIVSIRPITAHAKNAPKIAEDQNLLMSFPPAGFERSRVPAPQPCDSFAPDVVSKRRSDGSTECKSWVVRNLGHGLCEIAHRRLVANTPRRDPVNAESPSRLSGRPIVRPHS